MQFAKDHAKVMPHIKIRNDLASIEVSLMSRSEVYLHGSCNAWPERLDDKGNCFDKVRRGMYGEGDDAIN